jgi:hypothetical protein
MATSVMLSVNCHLGDLLQVASFKLQAVSAPQRPEACSLKLGAFAKLHAQ